MSAEIVDKRNIARILAKHMEQGDHIMDQFKNVLVVVSNNKNYIDCTSITTGENFTLEPETEVQQVHLVISVHLV